MIKKYSRVQLVTDKYSDDGAPIGGKGIVVERYADGDYEVQFEDEDGTPTGVFFAVFPKDIELVTD